MEQATSIRKRRRPGTRGQIVPRGKDSWLVRLSLGRDANGKRRTHGETVHGSLKDARAHLTKLLASIDKGVFIQPSKMTVDQFLDRWLKDAVKARVAPHTYADYVGIAQRYIRPSLGTRLLHQLTALDLQKLYADMQAQGLSSRTVRYCHAVIGNALGQAVAWRIVPRDVSEHVILPKRTRREMLALNPDQARAFLIAAASDRYGVLFALLLETGLRPGEGLGLQWTDIDFDAGSLTVHRALVPFAKEHADDGTELANDNTSREWWQFAEPKTPKSRRTIPLSMPLVRALRSHRATQAQERLTAGTEYQDHRLVFATPLGRPVDVQNLSRRHFKPIVKAIGLPSLRLYDLRHSAATLLLTQNEHAKVVSERLGHASVQLTLDTYSHVTEGMQQQATAKIGGLLYGDEH